MLARKAGYIGYEGSRSVAVPAGRERQKFNQLVFKTLFAVFLIAFFLIVYVALSAARTDYGYSLMQEKRQVQQLQRDNEILRVEIARLEQDGDGRVGHGSTDEGFIQTTCRLNTIIRTKRAAFL